MQLKDKKHGNIQISNIIISGYVFQAELCCSGTQTAVFISKISLTFKNIEKKIFFVNRLYIRR